MTQNTEVESWESAYNGYPEPTVIQVDENTDFSKMHERALPAGSPKVKRVLVGMKIFSCVIDFENWQREEPREIFEITPTAVIDNYNVIKNVIYVTYANGIIE